jgi:hypothetical protein
MISAASNTLEKIVVISEFHSTPIAQNALLITHPPSHRASRTRNPPQTGPKTSLLAPRRRLNNRTRRRLGRCISLHHSRCRLNRPQLGEKRRDHQILPRRRVLEERPGRHQAVQGCISRIRDNTGISALSHTTFTGADLDSSATTTKKPTQASTSPNTPRDSASWQTKSPPPAQHPSSSRL